VVSGQVSNTGFACCRIKHVSYILKDNLNLLKSFPDFGEISIWLCNWTYQGNLWRRRRFSWVMFTAHGKHHDWSNYGGLQEYCEICSQKGAVSIVSLVLQMLPTMKPSQLWILFNVSWTLQC